MRPTKAAFVPALVLSLVLGAALVARYLGTADDSPAAGNWASGGGPSPTAVHAATGGAAAIGPSAAVAASGHHGGAVGSVADQLRARPADVRFCVGASLEPFAPAWTQMATIGTDEAAERTRRCMMELVFTHVDQATAAVVRGYLPVFSECYRQTFALSNPAKSTVIAAVSDCVLNGTSHPTDRAAARLNATIPQSAEQLAPDFPPRANWAAHR